MDREAWVNQGMLARCSEVILKRRWGLSERKGGEAPPDILEYLWGESRLAILLTVFP